MAALVLGLSKADGTTEEGGGKGSIIHPYSAGSFEIILTLLTKVVAIHVRFSKIGLQGQSFEWALLWL